MTTIRDMIISTLEFEIGCNAEDILHLEGSSGRNAWYAAFKSHAGKVSACVIIVDLDDLNPTRIKVVFEESGPFAFWPTAELLDKLTPTRNETALLWRQACRTLHTGQPIVGSPYQAFSDSFLDPTGNITSFTADAERAAYRQGIEDRYAGVEMGDKNEDPFVSKHYLQWFDGWFWANNEIEVAELQEASPEETVVVRRDRPEEANESVIPDNAKPTGMPVFFAKPGDLMSRDPGRFTKITDEDPAEGEDNPTVFKLGTSDDDGPS